ncbi:MAG: hypothetical protein JST26_14560 [Bacteroidetes bacterium]|nr:hypothetical protein [Bacteroidota bacterium]
MIAVFLFYGNTINNKYALDDDFVTVVNFPEKGKAYTPSNPLVSKGFSKIPKIWTSRYAHDGEGSFDYRPIVTTSFAIEYGIFGQNPAVSHFINILFYLGCIWLIYQCIQLMFVGQAYAKPLAFLCSLLFLIHPLHTEVVSSLKSRDELMAFFFAMIALRHSFLLFDTGRWKHLVVLILALFVGVLSKRTAVVYVFAIPMSLLFFRKTDWKKWGVLFVGLFIMYLCYALLRKKLITEKMVRHFYHFENFMYTENISFTEKIMIGIKTLGFYVKMLLLPYPLRFYYGESMLDYKSGFGLNLLVALGFLGSTVWYYVKTRSRYFLYALLLFLGCIFPFLNVMTPVAGVVGERLAFTASFGFCLMLGLVLIRYLDKINLDKISIKTLTAKPWLYVSLAGLVCMVYVFKRNLEWHDKFTLFEHDVAYLEHSAKANSLMANEYFEKMNNAKTAQEGTKYAEKALKHYSISLRADSSMFSAANNGGVVLFTFYKNYTEAERYFKAAIRAKPEYAQAYENWGNTCKMRQNYDSAFLFYRKAIELNPKQYTSYDAIGALYNELKQHKLAEKAYARGLEVFPADYYFSAQYANSIYMDGREQEGLRMFEEAFKIDPNRKLGEFLTQKFKALNDTLKEAYYLNYNYIH